MTELKQLRSQARAALRRNHDLYEAMRRPRVLLIEDDEKVGRGLQRALGRVAVVAVASPDGALAAWREVRPQVILSDSCGLEVLAQARDAGERLPPVVVHSGSDPTVEQMRRAGAVRVVYKPADVEELETVVLEMAARSGEERS